MIAFHAALGNIHFEQPQFFVVLFPSGLQLGDGAVAFLQLAVDRLVKTFIGRQGLG